MAIGVSRRAKGAWVTQIFVRVEGALDRPLETELTVGAPPQLNARLSSWRVNNYAFRDRDGAEYAPGDPVAGYSDDLDLIVVGERRIDERRISQIKLKGPSVTPLP